jgi:hypothetical protein
MPSATTFALPSGSAGPFGVVKPGAKRWLAALAAGPLVLFPPAGGTPGARMLGFPGEGAYARPDGGRPPKQAPGVPPVAKIKSGAYWVTWANTHAKNSNDVEDLADPFKDKVKAFIQALRDAGATVKVTSTRRDARRAYLFHWCWLIALGKSKASDATARPGVEIEWDHGDDAHSRAGAKEMVRGFGLAVPPKSKVAPALSSNHIFGKAVDMDITWEGDLKVSTKDGRTVTVPFISDPNVNTKLHAVGASYGVKKHKTDAPHWSVDGH